MSQVKNYWSQEGKYQKAYDHFYSLLVPRRGKADTPEGELLRTISKIYYRYFNDGDIYENMLEEGYPSLEDIRGIDRKFLRSLEAQLYDYDYEKTLESVVDRILRFLIFKNSTEDKIFNMETRRLVSIKTPKGIKILKELECTLVYKYEL